MKVPTLPTSHDKLTITWNSWRIAPLVSHYDHTCVMCTYHLITICRGVGVETDCPVISGATRQRTRRLRNGATMEVKLETKEEPRQENPHSQFEIAMRRIAEVGEVDYERARVPFNASL